MEIARQVRTVVDILQMQLQKMCRSWGDLKSTFMEIAS